jgi:dTDP-4-dehydrorhamnose reductase
MKKILILGASGMAGHVVYTFLENTKKYSILGTTNSNEFLFNTVKLDIFRTENLIEIINLFQPDYVINCIGLLIKDSLKNPEKTIYVNSYIPHLLSKLAFEKSFKLIHISTDCVFSGKYGKYTENSLKDATDIYGLSKSLGEIIDENNLTIRTSIIGPELKNNGEGLFHWVMNQKNEIFGFKSNIWSGVTTLELAKFIDYVIDFDLKGLVHLTNNIPISKFELLHLINKVHNLELKISSKKDYKCNKSFLNTNIDIVYKVPTYEKMLFDQKEFMIFNNIFYNHYSNN